MKRKLRNDKLRRWKARRARSAKAVARVGHPRLVVFRSSKHIYAQLVDPVDGHTLAQASTRTRGLLEGTYSGNAEAAKRVGRAIAGIAREKQIERVVFNRNGFLYHGRVKALAHAAREAGLQL